MQLPRFQGLRGRLSYANVMATVALFFALTGTAAAVGKYLTASDPITAGDLAGSTYGTPVIADGKVTSGKIADGAITSSKFDISATAPNAAEVGGFDVTTTSLQNLFFATYTSGLDIVCPDNRVALQVSLSGGSDLEIVGVQQNNRSSSDVFIRNNSSRTDELGTLHQYCLGSAFNRFPQ